MKGKLICLIAVAFGGLLLGGTVAELKIRKLKHEKENLDAKLEELRKEENELRQQLEENHQKSREELEKMQELISTLGDLNGIDPMEIDIQIDPE